MDNTNSNNSIFEKINKLYEKSGYLDRHGLDLFLTIVLCIVFFLAISYYHILNNLQPIKADWENKRCTPGVIPFAGIINKGPDDTAFDYTKDNFEQCTHTILASISDNAFKPFFYLLEVITAQFNAIVKAIYAIRGMLNKIRVTIRAFVENAMGRALNITVPIVNLFIVLKSMIGKVQGTITSAIYTLLGSYFGIKSLMLFFIGLVMKILYALVGTIAGLWTASIFMPFLIPVATATTAVMAAILVPTIIIQVMMSRIMKLTTAAPPGVPACFEGTTPVTLQDGSVVDMKSVKIGSVLCDGSRVNAIMKLSSHNQTIYQIGGVTVTGNHSIHHDTMGWITVERHPDSTFIHRDSFKDPFVYCINTSTKVIKIGSYTFADWDDLDDIDFSHLKQQGPLSPSFDMEDIHKVLGAGFHEDCLVKLKDGNVLSIADVKVNDVLSDGERVCGVVKISGKDIASGVSEKTLYEGSGRSKKKTLRCTGNIMIVDPELGVSNTFDMVSNEEEEDCFPKYVHHLLTDWGSFIVNDVRVEDYNSCVEKYLPPRNIE